MDCDISISVCIPTYNKADTIYYTISSVVNQTFNKWEIIVVDDSDNDLTAAVVESFFKDEQRVKYYKNKNRLGLVKNWNECIKHAHFEYIYILHHDDFLINNTLEKYNEFAKSNPQCGIIHSDCYYISLPYFKKSVGKTQDVAILEKGDPAIEKILFNNNIACSTVMVKRECYQELGSFDENAWVSPDWEMWARIGANYSIGHIDMVGGVIVLDNQNTHLSPIPLDEFYPQQQYYSDIIISYFSQVFITKNPKLLEEARLNIKRTLKVLGIHNANRLRFGLAKDYLVASGGYNKTVLLSIILKAIVKHVFNMLVIPQKSYAQIFETYHVA